MNYKVFILILALLFSFAGHAYVIQGSSSSSVMDGDFVHADSDALEKALLDALNNYFGRLKASEPDKEIPDVTTEFFKFIKSYKIAERGYQDDMVNYTVLVDVDDVALNDLMYFVKNVVNTAVYNISGVAADIELEEKIASSFKEYKFDTKHQSEFQASLRESSTSQEREDAFKKGPAQYYLEMSALMESAQEGSCTMVLTTRTFSKTKEFQTLKTKSSAEGETDDACIKSAITLSMLKTLGYVRENFIPLPSAVKVLNTFAVTAENYNNFATPKKLMDELKTRSFIESYKIKGFAGSKLEIDVDTYVDRDVLLKKLQSIESEYGFSSGTGDGNNILLDFSF